MASIRIPTPLRNYTAGQNEVNVEAGTVKEALQNLAQVYPGLRGQIFNENGELRPFVNLFLGQDNVNELQGMDTRLREDDRLMLLPSIAGGSCTQA